jgi:dienelactone hydrolase
MVFILNGNGYAAARPDANTADAAAVLHEAGVGAVPVQLAYPALATPGEVDGVAREMKRLSHGEPIGIVGFSAGGSLALRLAGLPWLHVKDVLNMYGPPDLADFLAEHQGDSHAQYVLDHTPFTQAGIDFLSGPVATRAHIVNAFGLVDQNTLAGPSAAAAARDFPGSTIDYYDGPHGVSIDASPSALEDFLAHL